MNILLFDWLIFIGRFMFSKEWAHSLRFHCSTSCSKKKTLGSRGSFFLNDIDGSRREAPREKNNLGSQELGVDHISHQTGLELMCMFVFIDADSWDLILRDSASDLQCMKKELHESLLRKESAIRKKRQNLLHPGYYPWECRTETARQSIAGNHHIHSQYVLW